jgi:hypothetical protein
MSITSQEIQVRVDEVNTKIEDAYDDYLNDQDQDAYNKLSRSIVSDFVKWLEKAIYPSYKMPDESASYKFAKGVISAKDLATRVKDINGFADEVLPRIVYTNEQNQTNCEILVGGIFGSSLVAVELTQLIQDGSSGDPKSDLTEEFAWIFDYIRNVASNEQNGEFLKTLKKELDEAPRKNKQSKNAAIMKVLGDIKEEIGLNQECNYIHNPFPKDNDFKKATGGLPDVVSVYSAATIDDADGKNKLNFTAANSLTTLSMESDQLERHACMLALAIYRNGGKVDTNIGKSIESITRNSPLSRNAERQRLFVGAVSGNSLPTELLDEMDISKEALPKIKSILETKINITFFQTYTSRSPSPEIMTGVLADKSDDVEKRKELYREINQWNSYFLGNSQTIFNRRLENNHPEMIKNITTNQNNKSTPVSGAKYTGTHETEFGIFIDKFINADESISDFIIKLANPVNTSKKVDIIDEYDEELFKDAGPIQLSIISMMKSRDLLRESLLQNIFDVLESRFNATKDNNIQDSLVIQIKGISDYATKILRNKGAQAENLSSAHLATIMKMSGSTSKIANLENEKTTKTLKAIEFAISLKNVDEFINNDQFTRQEYEDYLASNVLPKTNKSAQSEQSVVK